MPRADQPSSPSRRSAGRLAACLAALLLASSWSPATRGQQGFRPPATEAEEVALALSAIPESMRGKAAVWTLGPKGYVQKQRGSGVTCLVERSRPGTLEPICWDAEGTATIFPIVRDRAAWHAEGVAEAEIERRVAARFASGEYRAPRRGGVAYMMSTENWVHNGQAVIHYGPHVMIYAPYVTNEDIGATDTDPHAPWVLNEGGPHAYIIVRTRDPQAR